METRTLYFDGARAVEAAKALGSEVRSAILEAVGQGPRTVSQLAVELGIAQPAVTNHVRVLEQAGLLTTYPGTGERGATKMCVRTYDEICLRLTPTPTASAGERTVLTLPVGGFSRCDIHPTCGLASADSLIGYVDDPRAFYLPERLQASILWLGWGMVEYDFANPVLTGQVVERIDFSAELCSEAPNYNVDYPSDITFTINGVSIGTWTCPGDMGDERGLLNPPWWHQGTQYGFLKTVCITENGAFIDGTRISSITPEQVLDPGRPAITVQLAVREDARFRGGMNIFGRSFGNYPQDLTLAITTSQSQRA